MRIRFTVSISLVIKPVSIIINAHLYGGLVLEDIESHLSSSYSQPVMPQTQNYINRS